ncbi:MULTISPECIES: hypothetical protein [Mammaliicoccus]|uniref:hypothetical protein n=1 Tax=Mammaliicoccus TaxID=2803850 RepID=UPI001951DCF2|nr:hypothetical protein [Mammaliicoccus sciuri]MCD8819485.1 hypothetical protein [Mammaliicoccus sciuri]
MKNTKEYITLAIPFFIIGLILIFLLPNEFKFLAILVAVIFQIVYRYKQRNKNTKTPEK